MTGAVLVIVLHHQVHPRRLDRDRRDGRDLPADAGHPPALRPGRRELGRRGATTRCCPSRVHAIVLVSKMHKPTLRALAYARATRPDTLEAVTVNVDADETRALQAEWERRDIPVPLQGARLAVPGDHPADHRLRQARSARRSPRDVVTVYIPEYVVGHWWEQLLHNQSALRLKGRLLFTPGRHGDQRAVAADVLRGRSSERTSSGAADGRRAAPPRPAADRRPEAAVTDGRSSRRSGLDASSVEVGPVAHGGHCVARTTGRVVFVRHALPGRAGPVARSPRARRRRFLRADAVEVLEAVPDRVAPPCPYAGPGGCGGCDWQHADLAAQRALKAAVVARAAQRLAGLDVDGRSSSRCRATPTGWAGAPACGTRSTPTAGRAAPAPLARRRAGRPLPDRAPDAPAASRPRRASRRSWTGRGRRPVRSSVADRRRAAVRRCGPTAPSGRRDRVRERAVGRRVARSTADGFWQVHPGGRGRPSSAPCSTRSTRGRGSGPSTSTRASACSPPRSPTPVGPGRVVRASRATGAAVATPGATCTTCRGSGCTPAAWTAALRRPWPARRAPTWWCSTRRATGAGATVVQAVAAPARRGRSPTSPATRRRWPATSRRFAGPATGSPALRAFDLFPMTHHVECVALLQPA